MFNGISGGNNCYDRLLPDRGKHSESDAAVPQTPSSSLACVNRPGSLSVGLDSTSTTTLLRPVLRPSNLTSLPLPTDESMTHHSRSSNLQLQQQQSSQIPSRSPGLLPPTPTSTTAFPSQSNLFTKCPSHGLLMCDFYLSFKCRGHDLQGQWNHQPVR